MQADKCHRWPKSNKYYLWAPPAHLSELLLGPHSALVGLDADGRCTKLHVALTLRTLPPPGLARQQAWSSQQHILANISPHIIACHVLQMQDNHPPAVWHACVKKHL